MEVLTDKTPAWKKWLWTTDHKKVGLLYLWTSFAFFLLAGIGALLVRLELATPDRTVMDASTYYVLFSWHGTAMVFLWIIPVFAGFGNYLLPLLIGAPDVAYPRLNGLSYWMYAVAGIMLLIAFFGQGTMVDPTNGGAAVGWTGYPPLSGGVYSPGHGVDFYVLGIQLVGVSSMMGAINFLVTIIRMRAPGVTFHNVSLFVWAQFTTALLVTFATPSIGNAMLLNFFDRSLGTFFFGHYDAAGHFLGGSPLLYQNLFWFYSHPAVYVMILPAMGIVSEVLPKMVKRPIFGYRAMAYSILAIALLGFTVWMHHMFATGTDTRIRLFFMMMTMVIGVPTGVKIFNWIMTIWGGVMRFEAPLLFCIGFIANFLIGGIDGVFMASIPVDYQLHMTYWVVSHLHYVLFGGAVLGVFAGIYYWLPLMSGRMYHRKMALWHFWLTVIGLNIVFMTMHFLGTAGMPRRVYDYRAIYEPMNMIATIGAFILGVGQIPFLTNIWWTMRKGTKQPSDPWNERTATEWGGLTPGAGKGPHVGHGPASAQHGGGRD